MRVLETKSPIRPIAVQLAYLSNEPRRIEVL